MTVGLEPEPRQCLFKPATTGLSTTQFFWLCADFSAEMETFLERLDKVFVTVQCYTDRGELHIHGIQIHLLQQQIYMT